ncbi:transglutaminase-like domain-containing protein [Lewinella sp. IMCC34183]|uniref:transglutaminase-like domain-containing protein n=1 Tax=Lewinella sp. IMCC34183 TaxID=2248762 RepID=UPI000E21D0A3|nr:transglutaminase-like domain-containing protein [Lewinella sp. IMCC34183]
MIRLLFLVLLLTLAGPQVRGRCAGPPTPGVPDSLLAHANSVVLSHDKEYHVTSLRTATVRDRWVILLLNGKHNAENVIGTSYDDESKITTFEVSATDAFGREFFRARKADITDERYTSEGTFLQDRWVRYTTVPCGAYPCTITAEVERKLTDFAAMEFPHWAPVARDQSLVSATFTATVPVDNELLFDERGVGEPEISSDGKERRYRWQLANLCAQVTEPLAPVETETLPFVRVALADFQINEYRGSFRDWQSFGAFIGRIMEGRDALPSPLAFEVNQLVEGAADEREKVDRLYRFMQTRCRYVGIQLGIGGWQPFSASYVDQHRYGDCKALSNYMAAMLREVGIASYPVLIQSSEVPSYAIGPEFATSAFNHMVLYVPSQDMYLECTSTYAPPGYLNESTLDRGVLWITPEGGELARTPPLEPADHGHLRTVTQTITADNTVDFRLRSTHYGAAQELFRSLGAYIADRRDQLEWLHHRDFLPDVSGSEYSYEVSRDAPEVSLRYATTLNNRLRNLGKRRFFPLNPYPQSWVPDLQEERTLPVDYHNTRFLVDTVHVSFPADLEIETGLFRTPVVLEHAVGEYRAEMRPEQDGVTWIRTLKLRPARLPAGEYADFRQFFVEVAKAESVQLVLREKRTK